MNDRAASPLSIGQVLTTSFGVVATGFVVYFVLAFIASSPNLLVELLAEPPSEQPAGPKTVHPAWPSPVYAVFLALFLLGVVLSIIVSAMVTHMMIAQLRATPFSLAEALANGLRAFWRILGAGVLIVLMLLGVVFAAALVGAILAAGVAGDPKSPVVWTITIPLTVIPMIVISVIYSVVVPIVVVERTDVLATMRRSADLTKGSRWQIFLLFLIVGAPVAVLAGAVGIALGSEMLASAPVTILSNLLGAAIAVVMWALTAVIYYYLRTAEEQHGGMLATSG